MEVQRGGMEGQFLPYELAELVRDIFLLERSGVLELTGPGTTLSLEFELGMLQYGEADSGEDLGRRLVRDGALSSGALAEAQARGASSRDLGGDLVQRGRISVERLVESFHAHLRELLCQAFRWESGKYRFREGQVPPAQVEPDVLHTVESYIQAIEAMTGFPALMKALLAISRPLIQKPSGAIPVDRLNLTPVQGFVLSRLDGTLSLSELLSTLPPHEEEPTSRFVYALLLLGAAAHEPPLATGPFKTSSIVLEHGRDEAREQEEFDFIRQRYQSTADSSPSLTLGVRDGASWEEIQEAYKARKAEIFPQRFLEKVRTQMRSEIRILEGRLVQAYLALQSSALPGRPNGRDQEASGDESTSGRREVKLDIEAMSMRRELTKTEAKTTLDEAEKQAEIYYQKAKKYYQQGDYHNCLQYCSLAVRQCEPVARFHHLMGEVQARNPGHRWQKMAEHSFQRAVELDAWNADYLVTLGQFYKRKGLAMRARKHFEKALEILPTHPVALEELSVLKA